MWKNWNILYFKMLGVTASMGPFSLLKEDVSISNLSYYNVLWFSAPFFFPNKKTISQSWHVLRRRINWKRRKEEQKLMFFFFLGFLFFWGGEVGIFMNLSLCQLFFQYSQFQAPSQQLHVYLKRSLAYTKHTSTHFRTQSGISF